jgi:GxxExxY protein
MEKIFYKEESYLIIGKCMEIHRNLGAGFLEIVYKDALEYELKLAGIPFEREKEYMVSYKGLYLPHKFYADFVVYGNIILEIKGVSAISKEFVAQAMNYLKVSNNRLALIINFGETSLRHLRVIC